MLVLNENIGPLLCHCPIPPVDTAYMRQVDKVAGQREPPSSP
jgi:hypothetical protein